jgi:hypothetical protein
MESLTSLQRILASATTSPPTASPKTLPTSSVSSARSQQRTQTMRRITLKRPRKSPVRRAAHTASGRRTSRSLPLAPGGAAHLPEAARAHARLWAASRPVANSRRQPVLPSIAGEHVAHELLRPHWGSLETHLREQRSSWQPQPRRTAFGCWLVFLACAGPWPDQPPATD